MEEYEAAVRQVPSWKIDWVKKIIANDQVIRANDNLNRTKTKIDLEKSFSS